MPVLQSERLVLRPLGDADARTVQRLAGDARIAATTMTVPHPYEDGMAEVWIATHEGSWEAGRSLVLGITLREGGELVGVIGLDLDPAKRTAELGYWVGVPWWGRGICTEAAVLLVDHGFGALGSERIEARHFTHNPASCRVMAKVGMALEGVRPGAVRKRGQWLDVCVHAISREEWERRRGADSLLP